MVTKKKTNKRTKKYSYRKKYNSIIKKELNCNYNEYLNLLKPEFNYKKYYKSYESGQQFKALLEIAFKYDPTILTRLMEITMKRFNPSLTNVIYNIITSKKSDQEIYDKLSKLYRSPSNKFNIKKSNPCPGNIAVLETMIKYFKNNKKINKYLDIGCGNGSFAITMGNLLKLGKNDIYGVDLGNFSEQGDWGREKNMNHFTFKELKYGDEYPFDDNTFDLITIKMVLHHVTNLDFTLKEIKRILKINGILIVIEHDSYTYADYMINDIEHGFYINVFNPAEKEKSIGIHKYYSSVELNNNLINYGFEYIRKEIFSNNINQSIGGARPFFYIYTLGNK